MLADMASLLAENPDHHGPIREGACTSCHHPHGGQRYGMLFQEYPREFYAPYRPERFQLCFSCHIADLVLPKSSSLSDLSTDQLRVALGLDPETLLTEEEGA